jgi:hypothetical protein
MDERLAIKVKKQKLLPKCWNISSLMSIHPLSVRSSAPFNERGEMAEKERSFFPSTILVSFWCSLYNHEFLE